MSTVAIMQPTYLPWCGYFDLMDQVDLFVFLDSVQFDRRSWQQRNRVKGPHGPIWLTVPVQSKGKREQKISDVEIDRTSDWRKRHLKTIAQCYTQSEFYQEVIPSLQGVLSSEWQRLSELSMTLIRRLADQLGIRTETVQSSEIETDGEKADLLLQICQQVDASRYLSPLGSKDYLDSYNPFPDAGIELCYHEYGHPYYSQRFGSFVSHLSVLDLLMNEGPSSTSLIRSGRGQTEIRNVTSGETLE